MASRAGCASARIARGSVKTILPSWSFGMTKPYRWTRRC
jgi:hypothetical protein